MKTIREYELENRVYELEQKLAIVCWTHPDIYRNVESIPISVPINEAEIRYIGHDEIIFKSVARSEIEYEYLTDRLKLTNEYWNRENGSKYSNGFYMDRSALIRSYDAKHMLSEAMEKCKKAFANNPEKFMVK